MRHQRAYLGRLGSLLFDERSGIVFFYAIAKGTYQIDTVTQFYRTYYSSVAPRYFCTETLPERARTPYIVPQYSKKKQKLENKTLKNMIA